MSGLEKRAKKGWKEHGENVELKTHIPKSMKDGRLPGGWMVKKDCAKLAAAINTGGASLLRGQLSALKNVSDKNMVKEVKPKLPKLKPLPISVM